MFMVAWLPVHGCVAASARHVGCVRPVGLDGAGLLLVQSSSAAASRYAGLARPRLLTGRITLTLLTTRITLGMRSHQPGFVLTQ